MVAEINRLSLQFMHQGKFVTLFYGIYNPETRKLSYTNAGHHPALVLRRDKILMLPATNGIPVGVLDSRQALYEDASFFMEPGDRLLLFTDAVFEERPDSTGVFKGLTGLAEYLNLAWSKSSQTLVEEIYQLRMKASQGVLPDDFTLMIFDQL